MDKPGTHTQVGGTHTTVEQRELGTGRSHVQRGHLRRPRRKSICAVRKQESGSPGDGSDWKGHTGLLRVSDTGPSAGCWLHGVPLVKVN